MVLYSVFKVLGVKFKIRPILEYNGRYQTENKSLKLSGVVRGASSWHYLKEYEDYYDEYDSDDSRSTKNKRPVGARIGTSFNKYNTTEDGGYDDGDKIDDVCTMLLPLFVTPMGRG